MSAGVKGFGAKYHARKHNKLNDEPEELDIDDAQESGLFSERCEKERWMEIHGDRRFPGTFYDFKDMAIQFGKVLDWSCHAYAICHTRAETLTA